MINEKKFKNSLYVLQGFLIEARRLAYEQETNSKLARLLDEIEYLPYLISSNEDKSNEFSNMVYEISSDYKIQYVIDRYNKKVPSSW